MVWFPTFMTIQVKDVVTRCVLVAAEVKTEKTVQETPTFPCCEVPMPITAKITAQMASQKERLMKSFRFLRCVVSFFCSWRSFS